MKIWIEQSGEAAEEVVEAARDLVRTLREGQDSGTVLIGNKNVEASIEVLEEALKDFDSKEFE